MNIAGFDKGIDPNEGKVLRSLDEPERDASVEILLYCGAAWLDKSPDNIHNRGHWKGCTDHHGIINKSIVEPSH